MITELTAAQQKRLEEVRAKWLACGRCCEVLQRKASEAAIQNMYLAAGKNRPIVLFFSSPILCILAHAILSKTKLRGQLSSQLPVQLSDQLRDQLSDQLRDQLWGQLRDQLWGQL